MSIRFLLAVAFCAVAFSAFAQAPADQMDVVVPAHDIARGAVLAEGDPDHQEHRRDARE